MSFLPFSFSLLVLFMGFWGSVRGESWNGMDWWFDIGGRSGSLLTVYL